MGQQPNMKTWIWTLHEPVYMKKNDALNGPFHLE